jgi:mannose-1-phosphate guanylyltransferase
MNGGKEWVVVLAAGEGTRLSTLTTTRGVSVPKQFCSLRGGASLIEETLSRAESVAARQRVVAVVADGHRRWWEGPLWSLPPENVIVQPDNKGTAAGLLLPLLHIVARDPGATVLVLPSDHFVQNEALLARSLERVTRLAAEDRRHVHLLGLSAVEPDSELGYIVPFRQKDPGVARVQRFVEKPEVAAARSLIAEGGLLNMFIIAASARALLRLYATRHPELVASIAQAVEQDRQSPQDAVAAHLLYPRLPTLDFSRHILEGQEPCLRVVAAPDFGWSDLGTPRRVAETLARLGASQGHEVSGSAYVNLAEQHARQHANAHCPANIQGGHP